MAKALLNKEVLVLNKSWVPVKTTTLDHAICLAYSTYKNGEPKAKIIETEDINKFQEYTWNDWSKIKPKEGEITISSANQIYRIPLVIRLTHYDKLPKKIVKFSRKAIYTRDGGKCLYCGIKVSQEWTLDHILPKSRGGATTWENICLCCLKCNMKKGSKTAQEANMKLRSKPAKPKPDFIYKQLAKCDSWESFISTVYWNVELESDN
jgi:5-methylcytosine-specific restriction endonuclease McrA